MAKEPTYPDDSPVGNAETASDGVAGDDRKPGSARAKHLVTGAAIGIGSAALVAALLYAKRAKKTGDDR
jgi:hypothetical protein